MAVHAAVPVQRLREMIYAYPTFHRAIEAALDGLGPDARGLSPCDEARVPQARVGDGRAAVRPAIGAPWPAARAPQPLA